MAHQPRRELMLETAHRLFNEHGFHATGIDLILAESGVSKATLYKYFRTKEELILEVLKRRDAEFETMVENSISRAAEAGDTPDGLQVLALFDVLHEWINSKGFFGCNFINASSEYGAKDDPIHQFAARHKKKFRDKVAALLPTPDKKRKALLADQLCLLLDGAIVAAQVRGNKEAAIQAKSAARALIDVMGGLIAGH